MASSRRDNRRFVEDDDRGSLRRVDRGERSERSDRRRDEMEPDDRDRIRGDPPRENKKPRGDLAEPADSSGLNKYFINGKGIHREVLQREICRFLGPEATSKPDMFKGVEGFMIRAVRPFTAEMIDDLVKISERYSQEKEDERRKGRRGLNYMDSKTLARRQEDLDESDDGMDIDDGYEDTRRTSRPSRQTHRPDPPYETRIPREQEAYPARGNLYDTVNPPPSYGSGPAYTNPSPGGFPTSGPYPPAPVPYGGGYTPQPTFQDQGFPPPRQGTTNYGYGSESTGGPIDPYGARPAPYPQSVPRDPPRPDQRQYHPRDYNDRAPEAPRFTGYTGPQPQGRGAPSAYDHDMPGPYAGSSSRPDPPYTSRRSPDMDPYRSKPPREERRGDRRGNKY